uniref:Uncharacterized protein n=1 Tax=Aegilops tauschii subsp. strangulata TaxID=200361 RepID=A0A453EEZ2_AEGTS
RACASCTTSRSSSAASRRSRTEVSALSPRVAFLDHQRSLLTLGNSHLKQRIAALAQDKIFKDGDRHCHPSHSSGCTEEGDREAEASLPAAEPQERGTPGTRRRPPGPRRQQQRLDRQRGDRRALVIEIRHIGLRTTKCCRCSSCCCCCCC